MIIIKQLMLGYQFVPKIATSSLFAWLYEASTGKNHIPNDSKANGFRKYFIDGDSKVAFPVENIPEFGEKYFNYYRFTITRDPIRRFLSMYSNRVVFHRELSIKKPKCADRLREAGLKLDPQINELVSRLSDYTELVETINHHSLPMMNFLGPDLSIYSRIVDISQTDQIVDEIREFWQQEGLLDVYQRAPARPSRRQTGGPKLGLDVLNEDSFEKLINYYEKDYENIPTISMQSIKDEYLNSRSMSPDRGAIIFPEITISKSPVTRSQELAEKSSTALGIVVKKAVCPLVEVLRVNPRINVNAHGKLFHIRGAVLIDSNVATAEWHLVLKDGFNHYQVEWGLPSPNLSEKFPNNQFSAAARFKSDNLFFERGSSLELFLQSENGEGFLLAKIHVDN